MTRGPGTQEKTYVAGLSPDDRRRHSHVKRGGKIVDFVLQHEIKVDEVWRPVVRDDCAHRVVHKDVPDRRGRQEKHLLGVSDLREAMAIAGADIRRNWHRYKERCRAGRAKG